MKKLISMLCFLPITGCFSDAPPSTWKSSPGAVISEQNESKGPREGENTPARDSRELGAINAPPSSHLDVFKDLALMAEGIPTGASDEELIELSIKADPKVTYFSYKFGTPSDCLNGEGYKVTPVTDKPILDLKDAPMGTVALCILSFHSPSKLWQPLPAAKVLSWQKVSFRRTLKTEYFEYDEFCGKKIKTTAVVEFSGSIGTYKWVKDSRSQGCDQDSISGKDSLTITLNNSKSVEGFWTFGGTEASGWYKFEWTDKGRTSFKGQYGYGDPSLEPAGEWNSLSSVDIK